MFNVQLKIDAWKEILKAYFLSNVGSWPIKYSKIFEKSQVSCYYVPSDHTTSLSVFWESSSGASLNYFWKRFGGE